MGPLSLHVAAAAGCTALPNALRSPPLLGAGRKSNPDRDGVGLVAAAASIFLLNAPSNTITACCLQESGSHCRSGWGQCGRLCCARGRPVRVHRCRDCGCHDTGGQHGQEGKLPVDTSLASCSFPNTRPCCTSLPLLGQRWKVQCARGGGLALQRVELLLKCCSGAYATGTLLFAYRRATPLSSLHLHIPAALPKL